MDTMDRRDYLKLSGAALATMAAGCVAEDPENSADDIPYYGPEFEDIATATSEYHPGNVKIEDTPIPSEMAESGVEADALMPTDEAVGADSKWAEVPINRYVAEKDGRKLNLVERESNPVIAEMLGESGEMMVKGLCVDVVESSPKYGRDNYYGVLAQEVYR